MIILQLLIYCLIFTLMVRFSVRGGAIDGLYFYPKAVQYRAIEIGLTTRETMNRKRKIFMTEFYLVSNRPTKPLCGEETLNPKCNDRKT